MKTLALALLATFGLIASEPKETYLVFGSSGSFSKFDRTARVPFLQIGHGVRWGDDNKVDICTLFSLHPNVMSSGLQLSYLYSPEFLYGVYVGPQLTSCFRIYEYQFQVREFDVGFGGTIGYDLEKHGSKQFIQLSFNNDKALSLLTGFKF